MLEKSNHGASTAVYNIYTGGESWIYAYEPETKQQSTVWAFQESPNPTIVLIGSNAWKSVLILMENIF